MKQIRAKLVEAGFLQRDGVYAIVDGQYGSTGKGLAAAVLAEVLAHNVALVTTNAGPNSGHTSYVGDEKIVLRQLPTFSVVAYKIHGLRIPTVMNAGAIVDPKVFNEEYLKYGGNVTIHPMAAIVREENLIAEKGIVASVGSTGKGTGSALASKIMRDPGAVALTNGHLISASVMDVGSWVDGVVTLMEVSQGYSLSLNASGFYPFTTSRDCTVAQAMSDAGFHPSLYRDCMMVVRTFPIRVAGNSGPCHADQKEISWDQLGQTPELTTVTNKVRRVFTFSRSQFCQAVMANRPSVLFVNFMNYLPGKSEADHREWVRQNIVIPYNNTMGRDPKAILLGYGPRNEDVRLF